MQLGAMSDTVLFPPASLTEADPRPPTTDLRIHCPAVLTPKEVSTFLTVSPRKVADLLATGQLASKRIGRRRVILRSAIEQMIGAPL